MVSAIDGKAVIEGVKALDAALTGVKNSVRQRIMRGSVNRALTIIGGEIRKSVPSAITPGHNMMRRVKPSVGTRPFRSKLDQYAGKTGLRVGHAILKGPDGKSLRDSAGRIRKTAKGNLAPHAHFIPLGTAERRTKSGANRGKVTPRGFVPQAYSRSLPKAMAEMQKAFDKAVKREWAKQKQKNRGKG